MTSTVARACAGGLLALLLAGCSPAPQISTAPVVVADQDGSGTTRLAPFTSGGSYRVDLSYACSPTISSMTVEAYGPGGVIETLFTQAPGTGKSATTYGTSRGQVVLEVGSINCTWHVRVTA